MVSGVDVGRLEVDDRDLPGSPNWAARFTILEGDPDGQFAVRTDPKTNEGVLSLVKVSRAQGLPQLGSTVRAELGRVHLLTCQGPPGVSSGESSGGGC